MFPILPRNMPMQAIHVSLADVSAICGKWNTEDTVWFKNRVVNHQFVCRIKAKSGNDNTRTLVSLIDTSDPYIDIDISKQLVQDNRAIYNMS